jgi:hypothetical protein
MYVYFCFKYLLFTPDTFAVHIEACAGIIVCNLPITKYSMLWIFKVLCDAYIYQRINADTSARRVKLWTGTKHVSPIEVELQYQKCPGHKHPNSFECYFIRTFNLPNNPITRSLYFSLRSNNWPVSIPVVRHIRCFVALCVVGHTSY